MSHGVHASVQTIEPTVPDPSLDHLSTQTDLLDLPPAHDPVLSPGERGNLPVKDVRVEFWLLSNQKSTGVLAGTCHDADAGEEMRTGGARFVRKGAPARRYRL